MADDRSGALAETCNLHDDELRAHLEVALAERFTNVIASGEDVCVYTIMTPHWPHVL